MNILLEKLNFFAETKSVELVISFDGYYSSGGKVQLGTVLFPY